MFCPRCAAPIEGTKFCRSCGASVSLVPQALSGNLPVQQPVNQEPEGFEYDCHGRRRRHRDHAPSLASGIQRTFMGIGFVLAALGALVFAPAGRLWWFWLLIPAFAMLGGGIAEIMRAKEAAKLVPPVPPVPSAPQYQPLPTAPETSELPPHQDLPGSIVEGTTRHLDPTAGRSE